MATITGIKGGSYTDITATFGGVTSNVVRVTVNATTPALTYTPAPGTITYNGSRLGIGTITYNGDGQAAYLVIKADSQPSTPSASATTGTGWINASNGDTVYATKSGVASDAGTYWVFLKSSAGTNFVAVNPKYGNNKAISKRTVNVTTAPTLKSGLKYTGSAQALINAGTCSDGGTMYYYASTSSTAPSFSTSTWSTTVPSQTNVGTYYVWYYCNFDTNNNAAGTNAGAVKSLGSVAIGQRTGAAPSFSASSVTATCVQAGTAVNAGAFTAASAGHSGSITYSIVSVVKDGTSTSLSGWSMTSNTSRVITVPASTKPGTYKVTVRATEAATTTDTSSTKDAVITVTLGKGSQTLNLDKTTLSLTVPNTSDITASGYSGSLSVSSSATSVATAGTISNSKSTITAVTAGTATITFTAAATDYVNSVSKTASVTVTRRSGAAPTFNNGTASATLVQAGSARTTSAFTAATAGHSGTISYSLVSAKKDGSSTSLTGWSVNSSARTIGVPANTAYGTYNVVVRATEAQTSTDSESYKDATIVVTLSRGTQTLTLDNTSLSLTVPNTGTITASGYAGTLSVASSNSNIATAGTISNSKSTITAVAAGTATITFTAAATDYVNSVSKTSTVTVSRRTGAAPTFNAASVAATCTQGSNASTSPAVNAGAFTAATAGHGGTLSYEIVGVVKNGTSTQLTGWSMTSNTSRVITVPQNTLPGTYNVTVRATEAQTSTDTSSTKDAVITVTLSKGSQTLTIDNTSLTITVPNTGTITASGYVGTLSSTSGTTSVATVSTNTSTKKVTVTAVTAGTSTVTVKAASTDYLNEVTKTCAVTVNRRTGAAPTFSNSTVSATLVQAGSARTTSAFTAATAGHSGSISYTLGTVKNSSNTTQSGWTIDSTNRKLNVPANTPYGTYTATVTATEAQTSTDTSSTASATITITLSRGTQTLTLDKTTLSLTVPNTGTITASGYAGTLSVVSSNTGIATAGTISNSKSTITAVTAGTATITFTAAATNYVEATTASTTVTVTRREGAAPTFNNGTASATLVQSGASVNCSTFTAATAGHSGTLSYEIVSVTNSGGTSQTGWTLTSGTSRIIKVPANTPYGTYTVVVRANEAQTSTDGASSKTANITVTLNRGTQSLTLTGNPTNYTSTYNSGGTITASGHSGAISASSATTSVATVSTSGSNVTVTCKKAGTSVITVTAAATNYVNAVSQQVTWTINKATQSAPTATGASVTYNSTATASASGGGAHGSIEWSNGSSRSAIGSQTTKARWSGDDNYEPSAYSSEVTLAVAKYTPTVTLSATNRAYNGQPLYATATVSMPSGGKTLKGTIYYGTSSGATTYSVAYSGSAVNLSSVSVTNYNASATVYAYFVPDSTCNDVYNSSGNASKTFQITGKAASSLPTTITGDAATAGNVSYHNVARATVSRDAVGGTLQYSTNGGSSWSNVTWTSSTSTLTSNPSRSELGTTTVVFRVQGDSNHENSATSSPYTLTVRAATDASMVVDVNSGLTYNASQQTIASVDTSNSEKYHGIGTYYIGYKKGSEATADNQITWNAANTTPLKATDAGTYYVYYKFSPDANHSNSKCVW